MTRNTMGRMLWPWLIVLVAVGCSSDDKSPATEPSDTQPPSVVATTPVDGSSDLPLLQPFTITFSEAMDPASVNTGTVRIESHETPLHLALTPDGLAMVVQPDSILPAGQAISLALNGPTDLAGNALPAYALHVSTGPLDCLHLADRFEPNGTSGEATPVHTDTTYVGLATCVDDEDIYSITLEDTLKVWAETYVDFAEDQAWQIYWETADARQYGTLGTTAHSGETEMFRHTFLPGTYYLRIYGYDEEDRILYDLRVRTGLPCQDDPYEDNDFIEDAKPLSVGIHEGLRGCYLDEDWYSVPILTGQNLVLTTDTGDYRDLRRSIIVTPDGGRDHATAYDVSTLTINRVAESDGEARVMLMVWDDDVVYDMTIEVQD